MTQIKEHHEADDKETFGNSNRRTAWTHQHSNNVWILDKAANKRKTPQLKEVFFVCSTPFNRDYIADLWTAVLSPSATDIKMVAMMIDSIRLTEQALCFFLFMTSTTASPLSSTQQRVQLHKIISFHS